jgi:hypothetical protein
MIDLRCSTSNSLPCCLHARVKAVPRSPAHRLRELLRYACIQVDTGLFARLSAHRAPSCRFRRQLAAGGSSCRGFPPVVGACAQRNRRGFLLESHA